MKECIDCGKNNAQFECEVCEGAICKKCSNMLEADAFSFLDPLPEVLSHTRYCGNCFGEHVEPARAEYQETLEKAEEVFVFFVTQKKEVPLISKSKEVLKIAECKDRDETILRLAFKAAQKGFNGIVQVEVSSKKIRMEAYQTSVWQGTAQPAQVDAEKIERQYLRNQIYR